MTINQLFNKRVSAEWKYNFSLWKMVIDWTVALYIVVPYSIFLAEQYLSWWRIAPNWLDGVPFNLLIAIMSLYACSGAVRLFIKKADQLFLWSQEKWILGLVKRGIAYSVVLGLFQSSCFFLLLAPFFLVHYEVSVTNFAVLFVVTLFAKLILGILKQLVELSFSGFKQVLMLRGIFIFSNLLFVFSIPFLMRNSLVNQLIVIASLLILSLALVYKRINIKGSFLIDVEREQKEELKYVRYLLSMSGKASPKRSKRRTRPLIFRESNLLFKQRTARNGLVELCIKTTVRNRTSLIHYAQLVLIGVLVIGVFPSSFSLVIWLGLAFILTSFITLLWKMPTNSDFFRLFKWHKEDIQYASQKFLFVMTLPGFTVISFFTGFKVFSWNGVFGILPVGVFVVYLMSKLISFYIYMISTRD